MFGNKLKSKRTDQRGAAVGTASEYPPRETANPAETDTKCCRETAEYKPSYKPPSEKAEYKVYPDEKNDRAHNTYYFQRRALTDAKIKQDSYAGVQQFYQRKDRIVASGASQDREYPQREEGEYPQREEGECPQRDERVVNSDSTGHRTDRDTGELPPDYGTLYPGQPDS